MTYGLGFANVLQALDVDNFLAKLALAAGARVVCDAGDFGGTLEELRQWLHGQSLVLCVGVRSVVRIGIMSICLQMLLGNDLWIRPVWCGMQTLELSAQSSHVLFAADDVLRFRDSQLAEPVFTS